MNVTDKPRRTKLTPERLTALTNALKVGNSRRHACHLSYTPQSTFNWWMVRGREIRERMEEDPDFKPSAMEAIERDFAEAIEQAEAWPINRLLYFLAKAAEKSPRAAEKLLAILDPERCGPRVAVDVGQRDNRQVVPIHIMHREMFRKTMGLPQLPGGGNGNGQEQEPDTQADTPTGGDNGGRLHDAGRGD